MILLSLIPALLVIIYTIYKKSRISTVETILIAAGGFIAVFNAVIVYEFSDTSQPPAYLLCIQQILSSMIVPIAYMYFARQMGRDWLNPTTVKLWMMMFFLVVPSGYYFLDSIVPDMQGSNLMPMSIHLFMHGEEICATHMADIIIACQALITLTRMFVLVQTYRRYHIKPSRNIRWFIYWSVTCIVFIIFISIFPHEYFIQPAILRFYYVFYSLLIIFIFFLFSLNLDLRPVIETVGAEELEEENEGGDEIEIGEEAKTTGAFVEVAGTGAADLQSDNGIVDADEPEYESIDKIDTFLFQSQVIADRIKALLNDKNRCLDINLTTESVISELGTNRTYFYRIMKAEFGCTFNDLLLKVRMKHATSLLTSTNIPVQEIAIRCGFSDNNSFSRRFKQVHGTTPSKYRNGQGGV